MGAQAVRLSNIDIDNALENHDFEVLFQPIFDLGNGALARMETFVRWRHHKLGVLPPGAFISFFETQGRMGELSRYVLEEALDHYIRWRGTYAPGFSINLATTDLADADFPEFISALLRDRDFPTDAVTLECPMPPIDSDFEEIKTQITAIRATGVRLAIEVRGRANEFLHNVKPFPFDEIKTGGAAILRFARTVRGPGLSAISELLEIANSAGASITAVGVEDQASLAALRGLGFSAAQGNHLGKVGGLSDFRPAMVNTVRGLLELDELSSADLSDLFRTAQAPVLAAESKQQSDEIETSADQPASVDDTANHGMQDDPNENVVDRARRKAAALAKKKGKEALRAELAARRKKLGISEPSELLDKPVTAARDLQDRLNSAFPRDHEDETPAGDVSSRISAPDRDDLDEASPASDTLASPTEEPGEGEEAEASNDAAALTSADSKEITDLELTLIDAKQALTDSEQANTEHVQANADSDDVVDGIAGDEDTPEISETDIIQQSEKSSEQSAEDPSDATTAQDIVEQDALDINPSTDEVTEPEELPLVFVPAAKSTGAAQANKTENDTRNDAENDPGNDAGNAPGNDCEVAAIDATPTTQGEQPGDQTNPTICAEPEVSTKPATSAGISPSSQSPASHSPTLRYRGRGPMVDRIAHTSSSQVNAYFVDTIHVFSEISGRNAPEKNSDDLVLVSMDEPAKDDGTVWVDAPTKSPTNIQPEVENTLTVSEPMNRLTAAMPTALDPRAIDENAVEAMGDLDQADLDVDHGADSDVESVTYSNEGMVEDDIHAHTQHDEVAEAAHLNESLIVERALQNQQRRKKNFLMRKYRLMPTHFWPRSWTRSWERRAANRDFVRRAKDRAANLGGIDDEQDDYGLFDGR